MKQTIKLIIFRISHRLTYILIKFFLKKPLAKSRVVLIPPTRLDGSFGDELMVATFVDRFNDASEILIYNYDLNKREDLLGRYKNLKFKSWVYFPFFLRNYREIHLLGADNMDGGYGDYNPVRKICLLRIASKLGLKASIKGFSINKRLTQPVKNALIEGAGLITYNLRDIDSYQRASEFLPKDSIVQVADAAFLCPKIPVEMDYFKSWTTKQKNEGRLIAAICPNSIQSKKIGSENYFNQLGELLKAFKEKFNVSLVFLYHDIRLQPDLSNDQTISKALFDKLNDEHAFYIGEITNGVQLKPYLEFSDFTITGRMHFGISGLSLGKPMYGITYQNKFSGLVKLFGVEPKYCLIDYDQLSDSSQVAELFIEHFDEMRSSIASNLDKVLTLSAKNFG